MKREPESRTYSGPEVAKILGLSLGAVYTAAKRGEIPAIKLGRRLLILRSTVEKMLGESLNDQPMPVESSPQAVANLLEIQRQRYQSEIEDPLRQEIVLLRQENVQIRQRLSKLESAT